MFLRVASGLRQRPKNFICAQCAFDLRRNVSIQPPRALFHSTPAAAERQMKGLPRIMPSKLRSGLDKRSKDPPKELGPTFEEEDEDGMDEDYTRSPEDEERLKMMKEGANVRWFEQDAATGKRTELGSIQEWSRTLDGRSEIPEEAKRDPVKFLELAKRARLEEEEDMEWDDLSLDDRSSILEGENVEQIREDLEMEFQKGLAEGKTMKQMRAKMREELQEDLSRYLQETGQEHLVDPLPDLHIEERGWTKASQRNRVRKLNMAMLRVRNRIERGKPVMPDMARDVWRGYLRTREMLRLRWDAVPEEVWAYLWASNATEDPVSNPQRHIRLGLLAKDMTAAGITLTPSQQLLTIESLFLTDWEADAIKSWKRSAPTLGAASAESFEKFWELGAMMFCKTADLEQACRAVDKLLEAGSSPRILQSLVAAYASQGTSEGFQNAWDSYKRLQKRLGTNMKIGDYDLVVSNFLSVNRIEDALKVFVDMMTKGTVQVRTNRPLPLVVGNKFFFGKWLKRLIGARELRGAENVVRFMLERQVQPSPIQVNGLIGALHRTGMAKQVQRADDLGWEMIKSRLDFVVGRREGKRPLRWSPSSKDYKKTTNDKNDDATAMAPAPYPPATLETFCVLAENYRIRHLRDAMTQLMEAFSMAELESDAFLLNQLLENHAQYGEHAAALDLYNTLVKDSPEGSGRRPVQPDPATFAVLWKILLVNRTRLLNQPALLAAETPRARATFAEMMRYRDVLAAACREAEQRQLEQEEQEEENRKGRGGGFFDESLARRVLHTFRRLGDPHGLVVALKTLHHFFGYLPSEQVALELTVGTTNVAALEGTVTGSGTGTGSSTTNTTTQTSGARASMRVRSRLRAQKKAMDIDITRRMREKALEVPRWRRASEDDLQHMIEEMGQDERGEVLQEYLIGFFMPKRSPDVSEYIDDGALLEQAAREMGVYEDEAEVE